MTPSVTCDEAKSTNQHILQMNVDNCKLSSILIVKQAVVAFDVKDRGLS